MFEAKDYNEEQKPTQIMLNLRSDPNFEDSLPFNEYFNNRFYYKYRER